MSVLSTLVLTLPLILQAAAGAPVPQQDIADVVRQWLNRPPPPDATTNDRRRSILPTIGATPAAGVSIGALLSAHEQSTPDGRLSVLTASASYSTKERGQVVVRLDQPFARGIGAWSVTGGSTCSPNGRTVWAVTPRRIVTLTCRSPGAARIRPSIGG